MLTNNILYNLENVIIVPGKLNDLPAETKYATAYRDGKKPLFGFVQWNIYDTGKTENGVNTIIKASNSFSDRLKRSVSGFVVIHPDELEYMTSTLDFDCPHYFCIDGDKQSKELYDSCLRAKRRFGCNIVFMVGRVHSPEVYHEIAENYQDIVDYLIVDSYTGVPGYPMASLLSDICWKVNTKVGKPYPIRFPAIVADIQGHDVHNAVKALALGADYILTDDNSKEWTDQFESCLENAMKLTGFSQLENFIAAPDVALKTRKV